MSAVTSTNALAKDSTLQAVADAISTMGATSVGNLSALATTDKSSLVGAVNEVKNGLTNKVGCTLIATTEATGTNKSKLNSLFAAYNALSQIDKFNAFIAYGNTILLLAGGYAFASIQCAFSNDPSVIYSAILDASDSKFALVTFSPSGGYSVTDQSNVTDANQFYLYTLN